MPSCAEFVATLQLITEQQDREGMEKIGLHLKNDEGFPTWPKVWQDATREVFKRHGVTLAILRKFPNGGTTNCDGPDSQPLKSSDGPTGPLNSSSCEGS